MRALRSFILHCAPKSPPRAAIVALSASSHKNVQMRTDKLSNGHAIPVVGFGVGTRWFAKRDGDPNDPELPLQQEVVDAVHGALAAGFVHIDTAEMYGTEREVGEALAAYLKEQGEGAREKLFITTKVHDGLGDPGTALRNSLQRLGLTYVDLYLIHSPFGSDIRGPIKSEFNMEKSWRALEDLVDAGLTRSIGVSNFPLKQTQQLVELARIKPVVNQIEFHPYLQQPELHDYCKQHGVFIEAYSPLLPLTHKPGGPVDSVVQAIAQELNATPGQVLLAWNLARGAIPITTTSNPARREEFLAVAQENSPVSLTDAQVSAISDAGATLHHRQFWVKQYAADSGTSA